ncbi:MAG: YqeG family HAD IIIA-type phosphatase [Candidatus Margulisiibacteriota bacterium]|jgi:hypothetical protein
MLKIFSDYLAILKELLIPKEIEEALEYISLEKLAAKGFVTILLDIDNTILPPDKRNIKLEKINWINKAKNMGFDVFLISNNINMRRIKKISKELNIDKGLCFALKPFPFSTKDFAKKNYINFKKTIIIGDQLLTDVLMGNWFKAHTILLDPIDKKLSFIKTLQREVELFILKSLS